MQLILDSDTKLDIKTKMTTFENTALNEKLMHNNVKQNLMNGISNCNIDSVQDNLKNDTEVSTSEKISLDVEHEVVKESNASVKGDDTELTSEDQLKKCCTSEEVSECNEQVPQEAKLNEDDADNNEVAEKSVKCIAVHKENNETNVKQDLCDNEEIEANFNTSSEDNNATAVDNTLPEQDISVENCDKKIENNEEIEKSDNQEEIGEKDEESFVSDKNEEETHERSPHLSKDSNILVSDQESLEEKLETQSVANLDGENLDKNNQEEHSQLVINSEDSEEKEIDVVASSLAETETNNNEQSEEICHKKEEPEEDNISTTENPSTTDVTTNFNHDIVEICNNDSTEKVATNESPNEILNVDDVREEENMDISGQSHIEPPKQTQLNDDIKTQKVYCKLSNTLDILSDDDDEPPKIEQKTTETANNLNDKQCINIEDDDDIMVIEEDNKVETTTEQVEKMEVNNEYIDSTIINTECNKITEDFVFVEKDKLESLVDKDPNEVGTETKDSDMESMTNYMSKEEQQVEKVEEKSLVPDNFLNTCKKNLADMTRDELEEFCVQKIVESIVDRSNLSEIKTKLKTLAQNNEEYKKKAMMLTKQIRDLQVVLKSVQEEQKKQSDTPITPLKITRSVGMQVLMTDKPGRRKPLGPGPSTNNNSNNKTKISGNPSSNQPVRPLTKTNTNQQNIPVPRLVPAIPAKTNNISNQVTNSTVKLSSPVQNGVKNSNPPAPRPTEKRTRVSSVTVDLTDDEPPNKITARGSPMPPVRLVSSQNLLAPRQQQFPSQTVQNSPRKVYIPISGPQGPVRPGQTIMLRSVTPPNPRPRTGTMNMVRVPSNQLRMQRLQAPGRHPAPLPDAMKQYQPPNWKALPPAPDLKLSKVENGIVISWKIEGYQEDSYEEIASYQLYAYQETTSPPSTALWKKIGDVKALPLPMACTLTQFMAGYKYYFAVRAVDIRSRLGPFSLPGSILLLNKM